MGDKNIWHDYHNLINIKKIQRFFGLYLSIKTI